MNNFCGFSLIGIPIIYNGLQPFVNNLYTYYLKTNSLFKILKTTVITQNHNNLDIKLQSYIVLGLNYKSAELSLWKRIHLMCLYCEIVIFQYR